MRVEGLFFSSNAGDCSRAYRLQFLLREAPVAVVAAVVAVFCIVAVTVAAAVDAVAVAVVPVFGRGKAIVVLLYMQGYTAK